MLAIKTPACTRLSGITGLLIAASVSSIAMADVSSTVTGTDQNAVFGIDENLQAFLSANRSSNGGGDQSLQGGDAISGTEEADLQIGALGIDVLMGKYW